MASLSIITTLYYSEAFIREFYERSASAATKITDDYEIVFVNDGSPDNSGKIVEEIIKKDKKVKLVELTRNFGHHKAILTGLENCKGELVFLLDCDLEVKPELLLEFYEVLKSNPDVDVIYGWMDSEKGGFFGRIIRKIFYKFFNLLSDVFISENVLLVRLMKRPYVQNLLLYKEAHIYLLGLIELTGHKKLGLPVQKSDKGSSTYSFLKKFRMASDAVISFSSKPLMMISLTGILMSVISFSYIIYLLMNKIIYKQILSGWTSVMVSVWFIGGMIITSIGIIGFYIGRIFIQVKNRPNTVIKRVVN